MALRTVSMDVRSTVVKIAAHFANMVAISTVARNVAGLHSASMAGASNTVSCAVVRRTRCVNTINGKAGARFVGVLHTVNMESARMGAEFVIQRHFVFTGV